MQLAQHTSDYQLVQQAKNGSEKAFTQLFNTYYQTVLGYLAKHFRAKVPYEELEDIAIKTLEKWFIEIKSGTDNYNYNEPMFGLLCFRGRHDAIKFVQRLSWRKEHPEDIGLIYFKQYAYNDGLIDEQGDADENYYELKYQLYTHMEYLRQIDATALMLYLDGKSHSQMAKILAIQPKAVNHRITRAKVRLKNLVEGKGSDSKKGKKQMLYLKNRLKHRDLFQNIEILELYYRENYRATEIAKMKNITEDQVRWKIRNDMNRLQAVA